MSKRQRVLGVYISIIHLGGVNQVDDSIDALFQFPIPAPGEGVTGRFDEFIDIRIRSVMQS